MKPSDILEWTMGWPWPVVVVLGAVVAWGIVRFMNWDEQGMGEDISSVQVPPPEGCVCTCE